MDFSIEALSEDALLLRFGDAIDPAINARVHRAAAALGDAGLPGIIDIAPAYASLLLRFDPRAAPDHEALRRKLSASLQREEGIEQSMPIAPRILEVPVCYGGNHGPDLDAVAAHAGMSGADFAHRHAAGEYRVAMLGFAPGFPYLLGLDPALQVPRRATPRTRVPAGSVAIGGAQTGIYPCELPGGWNLIGQTPLTLFDPGREPSALFSPGDRVHFRAIDAGEFDRLVEHRA